MYECLNWKDIVKFMLVVRANTYVLNNSYIYVMSVFSDDVFVDRRRVLKKLRMITGTEIDAEEEDMIQPDIGGIHISTDTSSMNDSDTFIDDFSTDNGWIEVIGKKKRKQQHKENIEQTNMCIKTDHTPQFSITLDTSDLLQDLINCGGQVENLTLSKSRLLAVIYRCIVQETDVLEARDMQKEKAEGLRTLCRNFYFRNHQKKSKAKEYPTEESFSISERPQPSKPRDTILISKPSITISTSVTKPVLSIGTDNVDNMGCKSSVKKIRIPQEIDIHFNMTRTYDAGCSLRRRVHLVRTYIREQKRDWDRKVS